MKKIREVKEMFESSLREMFVTRNMVLCGLMAALAVVEHDRDRKSVV